MQDDQLTPAEAQRFAALPREAQPGYLLEERTVQALASRGWIRSRRLVPAPLVWAGAAAACLVFFVAGFSVGQSRSESRSTGMPELSPAETQTSEPDPTRPGTATHVTLADADSNVIAKAQYVVWF
jgi:hypothetical protein